MHSHYNILSGKKLLQLRRDINFLKLLSLEGNTPYFIKTVNQSMEGF